MRRQLTLIVFALATLHSLTLLASVEAQGPPEPAEPDEPSTGNVEVRVWQRVADPLSIYISARPEGGSWDTLGTIPLPLDDGHSSNRNYRYGDVAVEGVEVRIWQRVADSLRIYISARPEGGSWDTLGTIPLPLDDGHSSSGNYRYGDITVSVPLPDSPGNEPTVDEEGQRDEAEENPRRVCRWAETAARVVASTVKVETPTGYGSAFYVGGGQFVTAGHVVEDRPSSITLRNKTGSFGAHLVGFYRFEAGDVALLSASGTGLSPLGWAGALALGTEIAITGYPEGLGTAASWTRGTVSRVFQESGHSYLQTDTAVSPGNSGGPVVDGCGRVAGVVSSSYVGERGSEGLHFAIAEPTMSEKLIALGLRGYRIAEADTIPDEAEIGNVGTRAVTYSGNVYVGQNPGRERLTPPVGTTISAVVGGVACDTYTTTDPRYSKVSYVLTVEQGCGGAEPGVEVTFTVGGALTDIQRVKYDSLSPKTIYWGESRELTFFVELKQREPSTSTREAIDSSVGQLRRPWYEASANIEAGNYWWYRTDSPYSCTPHSACFISWAAWMVRELDSYQGPAPQESAFREWRGAARTWWEAVDTWIQKAAFEPSAPLDFYAEREDEAWDQYKQAACALYALQGYEDDPRLGITGDSTDRVFPDCAATP